MTAHDQTVDQTVDQSVDQSPVLAWRDTPLGAVPVAQRFGDPYFSLDGGLAETGHVFHAGNHLPGRFRPGFHVAELGFGTGLNLLATVALWQASGASGRFFYTSFEAYPMSADQTALALRPFPQLAGLAETLVAALQRGVPRFALGPADVDLVIGDARATLPLWTGRADAWFLDGFAPACNPDLWSDALLASVAASPAIAGNGWSASAVWSADIG